MKKGLRTIPFFVIATVAMAFAFATCSVDDLLADASENGKLEFLTKITECHKRSQQYGERQRHRHHADSGIEKELGEHSDRKTFANQIVDIFPKELHQHHEKHDEECHREQREKTLHDEEI